MRPALLTVLLIAMSSYAGAEVGVHQHGTGTLDIAIEGNEIHARLAAPADDIVGFESEPTSDAEKQLVSEAVKKLSDALAILGPIAPAECQLVDAEVASALLEDHHDDDAGGEHDRSEDDHDHGEDDHADGKDEHAHGDNADHEDENEHSAFVAEYQLKCANPSALTEFTLGYFKAFPRTQMLVVRLLDNNGQTQVKLTPSENRLTVRPGG